MQFINKRMKNMNSGFVTPGFLIIILVFFVSMCSVCLYVQAAGMKVFSYSKIYESRNTSKKIQKELLNDFQIMVEQPVDDFSNDVYLGLINKYSKYNLVLEDISTGINPELLDQNIVKNKYINALINRPDSKYLVRYGWINSNFNKTLEKSGKPAYIKNTLPLMNIFSMDETLLNAVLCFCGISDAENIASKVFFEDIECKKNKKNLAKLFGVSENHEIFKMVGFKTNFWSFEMDDEKNCIKGVIAGVPQEGKGKICKYILISSSISFKRGLNSEL